MLPDTQSHRMKLVLSHWLYDFQRESSLGPFEMSTKKQFKVVVRTLCPGVGLSVFSNSNFIILLSNLTVNASVSSFVK